MDAREKCQFFGMEKRNDPKAIPNEIIQSTISLHQSLVRKLAVSCPQMRATAMFFFKKAYRKQRIGNLQLLHFQIAALYLAAKVFEQQVTIKKLIDGLGMCKQEDEMLKAVPVLREIDTNDQMFLQQLTRDFIEAERDIVFHMDFRFSIPLPYDSAIYMVKIITHWYIPRESPVYREFEDEILGAASMFLNDLQGSPLFYQYPPDVVAQAAIRLVFENFDLPLPNSGKISWYAHLLPFRDLKQIEDAHRKIREYFTFLNVMKKWKMKTKISKGDLDGFVFIPLAEIDLAENMCPPPPLELLDEIAGEEDTFSCLWNEHAPMCPPPPCDLLEDVLGTVTIAKQRTKSEDSLNRLLAADRKNEIQEVVKEAPKPSKETGHRNSNKNNSNNPNSKPKQKNKNNKKNKYGQRNNNLPQGNRIKSKNHPNEYPRYYDDRERDPMYRQQLYDPSDFPRPYNDRYPNNNYERDMYYNREPHYDYPYELDRNYDPPRFRNERIPPDYNRRMNRRDFERKRTRNSYDDHY